MTVRLMNDGVCVNVRGVLKFSLKAEGCPRSQRLGVKRVKRVLEYCENECTSTVKLQYEGVRI